MDEPILLQRPYPHRDEGAQGYLLRLAEANLLSLRDLGQLDVRFTVEHLSRHHLLPEPALDPALHEHVARIHRQLDQAGRHWNRQQARFCPHCLDEAPIWRAPWELLFHDACAVHGVWLIDQCSSCGQPLRWQRDHLLRCSCGADLRAEPGRPCPPAVQRLAATLARALLPELPATEPPLPLVASLQTDELQRLIRFFGGYLDPAAGMKPLKRFRAGELNVSWPVTSLAAEIMADWPRAFHAALSSLQDHQPDKKRGLRGFLQHAYHYLYVGLRGKPFDPVRDAFHAWLAEHWKGGLARRNRRLAEELLQEAHWIPGNIARRQLGVSQTRLRNLIAEGLLEAEESVSIRGRNFLVVRRDPLEKLRQQLAGEMNMTEAMALLGLGKIRMRRLLRLLFQTARRVGDQPSMPWCVPRSEVEALLALGEGVPVVGIAEEDCVSLAYVFKYWGWSGEDVVALVETVKSGTVTLRARLDQGRGMAAWVFETAQLKALYQSRDHGRKPWCRIADVMRELNIKEQVAHWLTQNGFLKAEKLGTIAGVGSRIRREDLDRFKAEHIFARDIAAQLGTNSRKVRSLLDEYGVHPLHGDSAEPCRMLVYKRCEGLQAFLDEKQLTSEPTFKLVGEKQPAAKPVGKSRSSDTSDAVPSHRRTLED